MLPAISPTKFNIVNDRSLSITWAIADGVYVSQMIHPTGDVFYHHVYYRTPNGSWESLPNYAR